MKRILIIVALNLALLGIIFGTYKTVNRTVTTVTEKPENVADEDFELTDIPVVMEMGMDTQGIMGEVKEAISYLPADALKVFNDEGWKILIVSEVDFSDSEYSNDKEEYPELTVGFTNFTTRTIQIRDMKTDGFIKLKLLHEMSHFLDKYYGYPSISDEFKQLYLDHIEDYVEFEYAGLEKTEENRRDIEYAVSDNIEFFACACKDYLYNTEYLYTSYPDICGYFDTLLGQRRSERHAGKQGDAYTELPDQEE